jgi:BMFP domain-containing protein YqiC
MTRQRPQLNIKLDSEDDQALIEKLRNYCNARDWTIRDAIIDAIKSWLENLPPSPLTTQVSSQGVVRTRLDTVEDKISALPDLETIVDSVLKQVEPNLGSQGVVTARLDAVEDKISALPDLETIVDSVLKRVEPNLGSQLGRQEIDQLKGRLNDQRIVHKQDLDARDKRLEGMRDALALLQAKIKELEAGQQVLASALTFKPLPQVESSQLATPTTQSVSNKGSNESPTPPALICPHCGNQTKFTKRGFDKQGKRRWKCTACKRSFIEGTSGVAAASPDELEKGENWQETATQFLDGMQWNERD